MGILISSRILEYKTKDLTIQESWSTARAILPLVDMFNHKNPMECKWRYNDKKDGIEIYTCQDIEADKEINISYGTECNLSDFYAIYGFLDHTLDTKVWIKAKLEQNNPLYELKLKLLSEPEDAQKQFALSGDIKTQLINIISWFRFVHS